MNQMGRKVCRWLANNGLEVTPHKTEAGQRRARIVV